MESKNARDRVFQNRGTSNQSSIMCPDHRQAGSSDLVIHQGLVRWLPSVLPLLGKCLRSLVTQFCDRGFLWVALQRRQTTNARDYFGRHAPASSAIAVAIANGQREISDADRTLFATMTRLVSR